MILFLPRVGEENVMELLPWFFQGPGLQLAFRLAELTGPMAANVIRGLSQGLLRVRLRDR